jgi:serine protease Do
MADYCDIIRSHSPEDTLSIEVIRTTTQEVMEGQLNGRELVATGSYGEGTGEEVVETESETGLGYSEYLTATDDREALLMDIPAEWSDMDGSIWESSWGNVDFVASSLQAAADIDALNNSWLEPGVWLAASEDWGRLGGYAQLLDGVRGWYEDECELDGVYDYGADDPLYEGKYDLWVDCGDQDTWVYVLAVRPKADPTAYLVLLQVQIVTDADLDALEKILGSFEVVGNLP